MTITKLINITNFSGVDFKNLKFHFSQKKKKNLKFHIFEVIFSPSGKNKRKKHFQFVVLILINFPLF